MSRKTLLLSAGLLTLTMVSGLCAADKSDTGERDARRVAKVLRGEALGATTDRARALQSLIDAGTDEDAAYWQAGYLQKDGKWVTVGQSTLTSHEQQKLEEYERRRSESFGTDEENYRLAEWCAKNGLEDRARAHLSAVLLNHPGNAEIRRLLGYQLIGGQWMDKAAYDAAVQATEDLIAGLEKWGPEITGIRDALSEGTLVSTNKALKRLHAIDDIGALPSVELILLPHSETCMLHGLDWLKTFRQRQATLAVSRIALNAPTPALREAAIAELRDRPQENFVPALLAGTRQNHTIRLQTFWDDPELSARGFVTFASLSVAAEEFTEIDNQIHRHGMQLRPIPRVRAALVNIPRNLRNAHTFNGLPGHFHREIMMAADWNPLAFHDAQRVSIDAAIAANREAEAQKDRDLEYNERTLAILNGVQARNAARFLDIDEAWNWWNTSMDLGIDLENKPDVDTVIEVAETSFSFRVASCFVAGTPVWTETGMQPIESLHVGDMVLSKHPESGELAYRPVIRTTVRETGKPLVTVNLPAEQITATPGHLFWVSGTGWVRARDLQAGQLIHTPTGAVRVEGVADAPQEPTYNLVVDRFHSYFVGESQVLVHDVSLSSPTDAVVPGLIDL